jgi:TRAP transporter TAXI family solute receptor
MNMNFKAIATTFVSAAFLIGAAQAGELPKKMTWSAYGTTSSGYAQSVAIGNMLKKRHGTTIRILPGKNDISRMAPLRDGKIDFCACGIAVYLGQEGVFLFADEAWGPQPLRLAMTASGSFNLAVATAADANIKTLADMKGKRVVFVQGGDALNWNVEAHMAFGGVKWSDVTKVTVSGFKAAFEAIINGQADAAFASTLSPVTKQLAASPRGLHWPPLPHNDEAGWKRANAVSPVYLKSVGTSGTNLSKDKPVQGATYPYPILVSNADKSADVVYNLVKSMVENFDDYKKGAKGATGWHIDKQKMTWALPYHDGAIRYWKEKGKWSAQAQAHNDGLIKRQNVIISAWKVYKASAKGAEKMAFKAGWLKARSAALTQAKMPVVFN